MRYKYKKADKHIVYNEDPDLTTMRVKLPKPPPPEEIIGYGLPPKQQKFFRPEIPKKLKEINNNKDLSISKKLDTLRKDPAYYAEEVEFIESEWHKRKKGVWYYINGKPTYITGVYYFYLTVWFVNNPASNYLPEYRDRDMKFFVFVEYCKNDPNCFGVIYPKHRREGATSKASGFHYELVTRLKNAKGGIQSKTETDAEMVFKDHIVKAWRKMPFWYSPIFEGSTSPKKVLSFNSPPIKVTASNMGIGEVESLESEIDFRSSGTIAYDGDKLNFYHCDEIGKTKLVDIYARHLVARECLSVRNEITGFCIYTSTSGEMTKGGGRLFKHLIGASDTAKRDGNGRTTSGLYPLFIPAVEGYIMDEYGASIIEDPKKPTYDSKGKLIKTGSKNFLLNERKQALEDEDYDKLSLSIRQYPIRLRDCFRGAGGKDNFNMKILEDQIDKYQFGNKDVTVGDFEWENNIQDGRVIFTPRENGRFKVSYLFHSPKESNRYLMENGIKIPANDHKFMGGGDTFKFDVTKTGKKSSGGGAVFMKRDYVIDPDDRPLEDWETHRFICTYLHRPKTKDDYCEDMLMMSIYYGCRMCPEINVPAIWDHFKRRDYLGYLHYAVDKKTRRLNKAPGYNTQTREKESIFRAYQQYIEKHGYRLVHDDLLDQLKDIGEDMGDYDLFAAGGMALIATEDEDNYNYGKEKEKQGLDISRYYRSRYI